MDALAEIQSLRKHLANIWADEFTDAQMAEFVLDMDGDLSAHERMAFRKIMAQAD